MSSEYSKAVTWSSHCTSVLGLKLLESYAPPWFPWSTTYTETPATPHHPDAIKGRNISLPDSRWPLATAWIPGARCCDVGKVCFNSLPTPYERAPGSYAVLCGWRSRVRRSRAWSCNTYVTTPFQLIHLRMCYSIGSCGHVVLMSRR